MIKNGSTIGPCSSIMFFMFYVYVTIISNKSWTLPFGNHKNIARICLSPDGRIIITVDDG